MPKYITFNTDQADLAKAASGAITYDITHPCIAYIPDWKAAGLVGPIDRGAYVLDEIESALWNLNAGDTTSVLHVGDAYYLGRVEAKKIGRTMAFEEDAVQKKMIETLRSGQFSKLRGNMEQQLRKDSVITKNQATYAVTLAMAMQNYSRWRG